MVLATVALPGKPEFPVSDGAGFIYDNIEDKGEIVKLDAKAHTVVATWPAVRQPFGAGDRQGEPSAVRGVRRRKMAVVDAESGRWWQRRQSATDRMRRGFRRAIVLHSARMAERDADRGARGRPDHYTVVQNVATKRGARTMAMDPDGSHLYLVTAEVRAAACADAGDAEAAGRRLCREALR